jgi:hypothetical protein
MMRQQLLINTGNTIDNNGLMEGTNGGDLVIDDSVNNMGTGSVVADGGTVTLGAGGSISGTFNVENGGVAEIVQSSEVDISFAGTGTVLLDDAANYRNGIISNFAAGDAIDLADLTYSPTANYLWDQSAGTLTISNGPVLSDIIHLEGSYTQSDFALTHDGGTGTAVVIPAADSIADGATFTVNVPSVDTVTFATGNGTLVLDQPTTFAGEIAGITGTGDFLDLHGLDAAHDTVVASTGLNSYDSATHTTSLLVTDETTNTSVTLKLAGDLSTSTWTVTADGNGGADVVDPPGATGQDVGPQVMHDPGPDPGPVVVNDPGPGPGPMIVNDPGPAAGPPALGTTLSQTLTDRGGGSTFVFNFANVGHDTLTDFHPATDVLQFGNALFTNAQAALNATQDDGHGNTVITLDAHDAITLSGVLKAQLHTADFHFV